MKRFLLLIPIGFLIMSAFFFMYATRQINSMLLHESFLKVVDCVDMLAAAAEATPERAWFENEDNIIKSIEFVDEQYQVYGAVFKVVGGEPRLITERMFETSVFDPFKFSVFWSEVFTKRRGSLVIGYTPRDQDYRDLLIYFRWMPDYSEDGFLVVTGVSEYSVATEIPVLFSAGMWVNTLVTFVLNVWLVFLIVRGGDNKWTQKRFGRL